MNETMGCTVPWTTHFKGSVHICSPIYPASQPANQMSFSPNTLVRRRLKLNLFRPENISLPVCDSALSVKVYLLQCHPLFNINVPNLPNSNIGECNLHGASPSPDGPEVEALRGHDLDHHPPVQRERQHQHHHHQLR